MSCRRATAGDGSTVDSQSNTYAMSGDAACAPQCSTDATRTTAATRATRANGARSGTRPIATQTTAPPRNAGNNLASRTTSEYAPAPKAPTVAQAKTDTAKANPTNK